MKKQAALNFSLVPPAFVHFTFCVFHTEKAEIHLYSQKGYILGDNFRHAY